MGWISRVLPSVQGRLVAGLLLFSAIVFALWPDHPRPFDPASATVVAAAAITWLFAELGAAPPPRKHDIDLFQQISEVIDDDALTFLRDHDFHVDLHSRSTRPAFTIAQWHGARYEFVDRHLQKKWAPVRQQIDALAELYGANLVARDGDGLLTAWLLGEPRHKQPAHVEGEIRELNQAASALYVSYNAFDAFARQRLGL